MDHRAEARAAAEIFTTMTGRKVKGLFGTELDADGAPFAEFLDDGILARRRMLDGVEPAKGKALCAVDAVVGVEDGEPAAHEVGAHLDLGLEHDVQVGGIDVIV